MTHNSAAVLPGLLDSAARHLPGARVLVVDCASTDDTLARAGAGGAATLALEENVGFGRACNLGLGEVEEPVSILVNPDVELIDGSLLLLAAEANRRDRPERLLAPRVLYPNGSRQDSVHPLPTAPGDLMRALVPTALLGTAAAPWRANRPRRVGWAVGCALAARTDTLLRLGPFDEHIFLYGEDLDLGLRAATGESTPGSGRTRECFTTGRTPALPRSAASRSLSWPARATTLCSVGWEAGAHASTTPRRRSPSLRAQW